MKVTIGGINKQYDSKTENIGKNLQYLNDFMKNTLHKNEVKYTALRIKLTRLIFPMIQDINLKKEINSDPYLLDNTVNSLINKLLDKNGLKGNKESLRYILKNELLIIGFNASSITSNDYGEYIESLDKDIYLIVDLVTM